MSNRLIRIGPLFVMLVVGSIALQDGSVEISRVAINILTLQFNIDRSILNIAPLWTIAVEFQFYLLMPLIAALIAKQGIRALIMMCSVVCLFRFLVIFHSMQYAAFSYNAAYYTLLGRFEQFAIGIAIAHSFATLSAREKNPLHMAGAIILILSVEYAGATNDWMGRTLYQSIFQSFYLVAEGIAFGYLIVAYLNLKRRFRIEYLLA